MESTDILIIGSGIAALQLATHIDVSRKVKLLTKATVKTSNSYLAQGGIAAAISETDSPAFHKQDTLEAGRYHNRPDIVEAVLNEAPSLIHEIADDALVFDLDQNGTIVLGMEGAHCRNRIVHGGGDATGRTVIDYFLEKIRGNIEVEENMYTYELLLNDKKCIGAKAKTADGKIKTFYANQVILATGGCGGLYEFTSNSSAVTGDGIAMAYRAGAEIADMEFIQFHPTLLFVNGKTRGLVSEAVRGEGGVLVTGDGRPIMEGVHPYKDLAPRHIVAQTIFSYISSGMQIYLDISRIDNFEKKFPTVTEICMKNGVDFSGRRIPVVPGSHFLMGGVKTDLIGRTTIKGLFAIGEVACTGLHGANRLASNSLLEGLYQGKMLAEWLNENPGRRVSMPVGTIQKAAGKPLNLPSIKTIKQTMMKRVGIVRSAQGLIEQLEWLAKFPVDNLESLDAFTTDELTKLFMLITAKLVTESALERTESRGGHYREDYPAEDNEAWQGRVILHRRNGKEDGENEYLQTALAT
ncbi:L-aspartate oxidase [Bacillus sp. EB01]|uniref:L-aspartate oxidase n=1 Tax=Bacillus sp. EB01 TaxID=1347086 RepID=UPI0005C4F231|nr:L-aspartate oxidase [Bacillus sp. EB01]